MVVIKSKKIEYREPTIGEDFIIVKSDYLDNVKDKWEQVKLALEPVDRKKNDINIYNAGLWIDETFTEKGKLGAVIIAVTDYYAQENIDENPQDTSLWEGLIFRTLSWERGNNKIQIRGRTTSEQLEKLQSELAERRTKDE